MTRLTPLETECVIDTLSGVLDGADPEWITDSVEEAIEILRAAYEHAVAEDITKV